jgi:hypothetical protein
MARLVLAFLLTTLAGLGSAYAQGTVAHVSTTMALQGLSVSGMSAGTIVYKDGYYTPGDMPSVPYAYSPSACTLGSGTGDNGAQFEPNSGGGCWNITAQTQYDARWWGVLYTGADPNGNNASLLTAAFSYVGNLNPGVGIPQPTISVAGPVMVDSTVTAPGAFLNIPLLSLIAGSGLAPSGGVCPAVFALTTTGTHNFGSVQIIVNRMPGVDGFHSSVNGTNHFNSVQIDHWTGICGSTTVTGASASSGTQVISVASIPSGLATGEVSRGNSGIPDRSVIIDIPDTGDCPGATACIVLSKATTGTVSGNLSFDTDANGAVCGFGNTNCGGVWTYPNIYQWLNNDPEVAVNSARFGYGLDCTGSCNDIGIVGGLIQEGVSPFFEDQGSGGIHVVTVEINNDNYKYAAMGSSSTISGATLTVGGTVYGTFNVGASISFNGMMGGPYTIVSDGTGTGGVGTYNLSSAPGNVTSPEAIYTLDAAPESNAPCAIIAAGGNGMDFHQGQMNGCSVQRFVTRATGTGTPPPESKAPAVTIEGVKPALSSETSLNPASLLQDYTNQTATDFSNGTVDPFASNFPDGLNPTAPPSGPGTASNGGLPNNFNVGGTTVGGELLMEESYSTNTTLTGADCGMHINVNNNSAAATITLPDAILGIGPSNSCPIWIFTGGKFPVTLAPYSAALINGVNQSVTLAQNTLYTVRTSGIPTSALEWALSPPQPPSNTPAPLTTSTGTTIGAVSIVNGTIRRSGCGATLTDTTANATQIENAMASNGVALTSGLNFRYINTCSVPVTIAGGTGVTPNSGDNMTVAPGGWQDFLLNITAIYPTPAITMYYHGSGGGHGQLVGVQVFTAGTCSAGCTYTPDVGTTEVIVEEVGSGAGGGGAAATGASQSAEGMGGGAGSYVKYLLTSGFSGVTITAPAGGTGGSSGAAGTAGSAATFGSIISCPGGLAGSAGAVHSSAFISGNSGKAPICTTSAGTTLATVPGGSSINATILTAGSVALSGFGASGPLGSGGPATTAASGNGNAAVGYGAGGGGGSNSNASEATAVNGGNGSPGEVVVYEYN